MLKTIWDWMYEQALEGTGLDILVIVVGVLTFIFGGTALIMFFG